MATTTKDRKRELYGPERNIRVQKIKDTLTKSHVLQEGEYNFTNKKLKKNIWTTSHTTDFSGSGFDTVGVDSTPSQLVHHFEMGNMSGKHLDKTVYRRSTTQDDFHDKGVFKPDVHGESRDVNWPDMNPKLIQGRNMGPSEYHSTFITNLRSRSAPNYPRVDTSKMPLPLDPTRFWRQRNTNLSLGSDGDGLISEHQRAFGRGSMAFTSELGQRQETLGINKKMTDLDKESHVFRGGDYNDIAGNFISTCVGDFGPRTVPAGEAAILKGAMRRMKEDEEEEEEDDPERQKPDVDSAYANTNRLQKFARENTVPVVFKDAADGRDYQTQKHFHFGHDEDQGNSIYNKDYTLSSMVSRQPPTFYFTPSAGRLLQFDPNQSKFGQASSSLDFMGQRAMPYRNSAGKTALEMNIDKRDTDNVIMSFDLSRNKLDRQKSINHRDYIGPPRWFRAMLPAGRPWSQYDYLQTDDALPYPPPTKDRSEAKHNFSGMFTKGPHAIERRSFRGRDCKSRLEDGRSTHFVIGYSPFDFDSETKMKYQGRSKDDQAVPAAGKTEAVHPVKFAHLSISDNQQDAEAADPHITNTRESLHSRMNYIPPRLERMNTTSVMKKDYGPLGARTMTESQLKTLDKYEKLLQKDISSSHFFHTDNSGRDNFVTTAMDDFIKPETMTGRKFLAAR